MVQERVVNIKIPDLLHKQIKSSAALEGVKLKDFIISVLNKYVQDTKGDILK